MESSTRVAPAAATGSSEGSNAPAPSSPSPTSPAEAKRVLVVDDCFDSAEMLAAFLEIHGHEAHVANDGRSAIEEAERVRPDVAILDIGLPDLDGCDVARALRKSRPEILLIALTGYAGEQDRLDFVNAGFDAHLLKPVELHTLASLVSGET